MIKNILEWMVAGLIGIAYIGVWLFGIGIHLWTIIIALMNGGIIMAGLTLIFPFVAEAYWFFDAIGTTGTWFNTYCVAIAIYIILVGVSLSIRMAMVNRAEKKE